MDKKELRDAYKKKRATLSLDSIDKMSLAIANQVLKLPIWDATYFHVFLPIKNKNEVDTEYLLHILQGKDKSVVLSKTDFQSLQMSHILLQENTALKISEYGIPEPVDGIAISELQIEVVFVPLLAYDTAGNRIGYGKGFYDRFLSRCKDTTIKVGLSFFEPEDHIVAMDTDIPLNYAITPTKMYTF